MSNVIYVDILLMINLLVNFLMLSAAGLNCVVEGDANGTVQAQSADPGSSVQRGTVVTITCG